MGVAVRVKKYTGSGEMVSWEVIVFEFFNRRAGVKLGANIKHRGSDRNWDEHDHLVS